MLNKEKMDLIVLETYYYETQIKQAQLRLEKRMNFDQYIKACEYVISKRIIEIDDLI